MKKGNKNELFNFGKGWGTIIFCLLMFWFYAGMVNDVPMLSLLQLQKNLAFLPVMY